MNNKKKIILIIVSILIAVTLVIGGTFAYFGWRTEKEALVNVTVSSGTGTCELINDNDLEIFPTYSKYHGRKIKLHAKQEMAEKAYITWTMVINEINGLQDSTFKYELVNMTTGESYGSGTFENITNEEGNNTITFSNNEEVLGYNRDYEFMLYLWIDGTFGNNPLDMSNQNFDFDMNCSITGTDNGTVTEQNVLMIVGKVQNASNYFLNSQTITRGEIKSVIFLENANIPEGAIDVSKEKNNSVMMWNSEADGEGLYDIYIGSEKGKVIIENGSNLFMGLSNVTSIDLSNINGLHLVSMDSMFRGCSSLTTLDLSSFNTSKVTNMVSMFEGNTSLKEIKLSNFDTSNVTDMAKMFRGCSSLTSLDVNNFNTSNVTTMESMFRDCSSLTTLDLSNFDTSNVICMNSDPGYYSGGMFQNCSKLKTLILSEKFNTKKVTSVIAMFSGCSSLISLDLSSFNTSNVTTMNSMFSDCSNLTSLDLSNFDTSNVKNMCKMFYNCSSLLSLELSNFNTFNVTDMRGMFYNCSSLTSLLLTNFDVTNVKYMGDSQYGGMFTDCSSLVTLDLSSFRTSAVTSVYRMFAGCTSLTTINLSNFDPSNVTKMTQMFRGDSSLQEVYLNSADFSNASSSMAFIDVPSTVKIYVKDENQQSILIAKSKNQFTTENVIIDPIVVNG